MRTAPLRITSVMLLLLAVSFIVPRTVDSQSYLGDVYKYTSCSSSDCSNTKCMSGYRINTDWAHWTVSDSFGTSYGFCGWAWENRCKCNACNRGHFDSLTDCTQCPAGSYQPDYGQRTCSPCSSGTVSSDDRQSCR
ncbi:hypothetical protein TrRE_jg802 [Triparma retinervis]|uniref:Tyrosine-protein kinase ephrin type A/B receptor-like domain-containing protein n=1 Tax=Triparma retinervis TaxID=2557542 RepID=A0A9W7L376_9STRA|nr:hypothetical protein TrRE_jg802 [Triparma retinervis]